MCGLDFRVEVPKAYKAVIKAGYPSLTCTVFAVDFVKKTHKTLTPSSTRRPCLNL